MELSFTSADHRSPLTSHFTAVVVAPLLPKGDASAKGEVQSDGFRRSSFSLSAE